MKNKAFTLIELLAVIVILAIIALIATPAVLNIIEDSRKGAAEASARSIVSAAKTYYMQETMNGRTVSSIDLSTDTLKYDGDQASKGTITFTDGKPSSEMYINGYCVTIEANGKIKSEKMDEEDCMSKEPEVTPEPEPTPEPTTYKKYNNGDYVYFNPKDNEACESATSSATGTNDTCMKWYAFLDSEESSTVNLILDHNTTATVAWANSGEKTPTLANAQLQTDITNWDDSVKATARLIRGAEINQISPRTDGESWAENEGSYYYLHSGDFTSYAGAAGTNNFAWLFDNTNNCEVAGCNSSGANTEGYWTASYWLSNYAWCVMNNGDINGRKINSSTLVGIRPVITVNKSLFPQN